MKSFIKITFSLSLNNFNIFNVFMIFVQSNQAPIINLNLILILLQIEMNIRTNFYQVHFPFD